MGFLKEQASTLSGGEASDAASGAGSAVGMRNIALRVLSYDLQERTTTGIDLATGETLTIQLRELDKPSDRSDVAEWSMSRFEVKNRITRLKNPKAVMARSEDEEGGVIIFEAVRREADGKLIARWGTVAAHSAEEADVFVAFARPATAYGSPTKPDEKRPIEIVRPLAAVPVTNEEELRSRVVEVLSRPFTSVVVRADDGEEVRASVRWKGKEQDPDAAYDAFRTNDRHLGRLLNPEAFEAARIEVFQIERVYPGSDYKKTLLDPSKLEARRFLRDWSLGQGAGFGFAETILALRAHDEGGQYYTMMRPTSSRPALWASVADIPTPNIQPRVAPVTAPASEGAARDESDAIPESSVASTLASASRALR